ncbi:lysylphosphatidylglycerol synthase transmembrane domain-containing protein [Marinilabiliaceae bacterium ANBcel2]|nr:lysylphosphatidylglycerol synthase transmembrane domain-containing protein [Marinilabiliaceae bacterium ANBcel2]
MRRKVALYLKIFFSLALIVFLLTRIDFTQLYKLKFSFIPYFFGGITISLIAISIMTYRWKILTDNYLKIKIRLKQLYQYYLTGSFFNIFLPGAIGGDVVRTQRLSTRHDVKVKKATIITIAERFAGIYGLAIILAFSFMFMNFPEGFQIQKFVPDWLLMLSPVIVLAFSPLLKWILKKRGLVTNNRFILQITAISLLAQMGDITIAWLFSQYFGLNLNFTALIFIMPFVYIATVLPISLGGLGIREGAFSGLMMLYGIDTSIAILISLLMYLVKVAVGVIGYGVYLKGR